MALKSEQNFTKLQRAQITAGIPSRPRKKKYIDLDKRLKEKVENFDQGPVDDYLNGIAHNICFYN